MRLFESIFKDELGNYAELLYRTMTQPESYICQLASLDRFLIRTGLGEKKLSEETINQWLDSRALTPNYRALITCIYRRFAEYLQSHGYPAYAPESPVTERAYLPHIFTDTEMDKIWSACDNLKVRYKTNRTPVMFPVFLRIAFGTGMRLNEILRLKVSDIDLNQGTIAIWQAKEKRQRKIPIHGSLSRILVLYMGRMEISDKPESFLFPGKNGKHCSPRWAQQWFSFVLGEAGIPAERTTPHGRGPCIHCLRHGFAYRSLKQARVSGMPFEEAVPFLSTYLGHKGINGTDKYLRFSHKIFDDEHKAFEQFTSGMFPEVDYEEE